MGKRGTGFKKDKRNPKKRNQRDILDTENVDDEIDVFHKQRDVVPLDINGDSGDSDEDAEHPVFDLQDIDEDNDEEDDEEDEEEDEDDIDDAQLSKFAAKIARQQKHLKAKFGGADDEINDDDEEEDDEDEKEGPTQWGGIKSRFWGGDNRDFELHSSDDEAPKEEEEVVKEMQKERAKKLSNEDFGLGDDETNRELTLEEMSLKGRGGKLSPVNEEHVDDLATFEEVKKDLNALSKEEQMDVVHSSAPELIGLLSELNASVEELESKVNPLLIKAEEGEIFLEDGTLRYLEVKQTLLLAYCQAITFYLLLKSEGHPVRDHPVLGRIVEIQGLLDKVKQLDENLPFEWEEILKNKKAEPGQNFVKETSELVSGTKDNGPSVATDVQMAELEDAPTNLLKIEFASNSDNKGVKLKRKDDQVGVQSREMLKVRAALEEKLKQKGTFTSNIQKSDKTKKHRKVVNGQLETSDDFADDAMDVEGLSNGHAISKNSNIAKLITARQNKSKVISGDDDLPKRDDIGERRRKHELRVLAGATVKSEDDHGGEYDMLEDDEGISEEENGDTEDAEDSEDDFYKQVKQQRAAKLAAKAEIYTRTSVVPSLPETVEGKRHISHQIEKNRGLTRQRNKNIKNPRKKYRLQSKKREKQRKGQVRDIRKQTGQYGGETSGINIGISRSVRFKG